jgi:hypothetical protein
MQQQNTKMWFDHEEEKKKKPGCRQDEVGRSQDIEKDHMKNKKIEES